MSEESLLRKFPRLADTHFRMTSPKSHLYTCIAWAAGDDRRFWLPDTYPEGLFYWPDGVPREDTLPGWIAAFESLGYRGCDAGELEEGFEKVAFYVDTAGKPQHAARQLTSGLWTSKVGKLEDIEHELEGLEGGSYGSVAVFMRRPLQIRD